MQLGGGTGSHTRAAPFDSPAELALALGGPLAQGRSLQAGGPAPGAARLLINASQAVLTVGLTSRAKLGSSGSLLPLRQRSALALEPAMSLKCPWLPSHCPAGAPPRSPMRLRQKVLQSRLRARAGTRHVAA